jgi:hypothetical protein
MYDHVAATASAVDDPTRTLSDLAQLLTKPFNLCILRTGSDWHDFRQWNELELVTLLDEGAAVSRSECEG